MNPLIQKLVRQLTADKKKLSMMIALLAVAMLMWGRLLLQRVPRTATADPVAVQAAQANGPTTTEYRILPVVTIEPAPRLTRDLFALDAERYVKVAEATAAPAKSDPDRADEERAAEAVHEAARRLSLQSIVQGSRPRAMVNGQLLAVGQKIEGFVLVRIDQRHVLMRKDGVEVPLSME